MFRRPAFSLIALLLFSSQFTHGQTAIRGHVTDQKDSPVSFCTAILKLLPDSSILATDFTDTLGNFRLTSKMAGHVLLQISGLGYKTATIIPKENAELKIVLQPALGTALKDVLISGQKKLIEKKVDRTVFNVANSITSTGGDAFDALKKAPGVQVNNGIISMTGKSTVSVMINDRLVQLSGDELEGYLRSIASDNIAKIEIINAPPARYDAAGNSGIVNIVLKKQAANGLNGNLTLAYQQRFRGGMADNGSFNYRQGKFNVFGNLNFRKFGFTVEEHTATSFADQRQEQVNDQRNTPFYTSEQIGTDYNLNSKMVIGFLYTINTMQRYIDQVYTAKVIGVSSNTVDSLLRTDAHSLDHALNHALNLNYEWKLDTSGKKLNIDLDYFTRKYDRNRNFINSNYFENGLSTGFSSNNLSTSNQFSDIYSAKTDLTIPTRAALFTLGGKLSFIHTNSNNIFSVFNGMVYLNDTSKSNEFDYHENTQAIYGSAQKTFGKWTMQLGLRGEYTQTTGLSATTQQSNKNSYFQLFPTGYIQYQASENYEWNLSYNRRIERPDFGMLNPFRSYTTANSYEDGNQFLQPSYANNLELTCTVQGAYSFSVFTNIIQPLFARVSIIDQTNNFYRLTNVNTGKEFSYGVMANGSLHPLKFWDASYEFTGFYYTYQSSFYGNGARYTQPTASININNDFTLNKGKTLLAELGIFYTTTEMEEFNRQTGRSQLDAGLKALLGQKNWVLAITFQDMFKANQWKVVNEYNGMRQSAYWDEQTLRASITWKFGNKNIKEKRERNELEEGKRAK